MELTEGDIRRLKESGRSDFFHEDNGGYRLRNIDGRCVFLDEEGKCSVYSRRPAGCRLYPMVMDLSNWNAVMDEDCPHRKDFPVDPDDVMRLDELIRELMEERR